MLHRPTMLRRSTKIPSPPAPGRLDSQLLPGSRGRFAMDIVTRLRVAIFFAAITLVGAVVVGLI